MKRACKEIRRLIKINAIHRRGFALSEMTSHDILEHAVLEMRELNLARDEDQLEELADIFGCLIHFAIRRKFSKKQIEDMLLKKLKLRFFDERK